MDLFLKGVKYIEESGIKDFEKCSDCNKICIDIVKSDMYKFLCSDCKCYCSFHKKYYNKKDFSRHHSKCKEKEILACYEPIINPLLCTYRIIKVNRYGFSLNQDLQSFRCNLIYYSKDFDELLEKKYNIKYDEQDVYRDNRNILTIFLKEKDNLKHLSWKIDGYY